MSIQAYNVLQPIEETILVANEKVVVRTFKAGEIGYVLPRIRVLFAAMATPTNQEVSEHEPDNEINWLRSAVTSIFNELEAIFGQDETFDLMAKCIDKSVEFTKDLDLEDARRLFNSMFKVNFTYFFQLALPATVNDALKVADSQEKVEALKQLLKK